MVFMKLKPRVVCSFAREKSTKPISEASLLPHFYTVPLPRRHHWNAAIVAQWGVSAFFKYWGFFLNSMQDSNISICSLHFNSWKKVNKVTPLNFKTWWYCSNWWNITYNAILRKLQKYRCVKIGRSVSQKWYLNGFKLSIKCIPYQTSSQFRINNIIEEEQKPSPIRA